MTSASVRAFALRPALALRLHARCITELAPAAHAVVTSSHAPLTGSFYQTILLYHEGAARRVRLRADRGAARAAADRQGLWRAARHVVHCVSPRCPWGAEAADAAQLAALQATYAAALECADGLGAASVVLPAVGAGVCNYPPVQAAAAALAACQAFAAGTAETGSTFSAMREISFSLFSPATVSAFGEAAAADGLRETAP